MSLMQRPMRVLAVDDDWAITKLVRLNLETQNFRVTEARTGLDGIRALREEGADLVLLDLRLPDFSGWGILSLLKLTDSLRNVPVIVVSVEPPDETMIRRFQPDDYLQKPFDVRDLLLRVQAVLSRRLAGEG